MSLFSHMPGEGYLYYGMRASGRVERLRGSVEGDRWVFEGETAAGGKRVRTRATITPDGSDAFRFVGESAEGDGPWKADDPVRYIRVK